jgi:hypothetical protein
MFQDFFPDFIFKALEQRTQTKTNCRFFFLFHRLGVLFLLVLVTQLEKTNTTTFFFKKKKKGIVV